MSLSGDFNDWLTGNPTGTADAAAATIAAQQQTLVNQANTNLADGTITQDQYNALVNSPAITESDAPNTISDTLAIGGAAAEGAAQAAAGALTNPLGFLGGGLNTVLSAVWNQVLAFLKQIPWYVWVGAALAIFIWLGGGGFLERKARKSLSK